MEVNRIAAHFNPNGGKAGSQGLNGGSHGRIGYNASMARPRFTWWPWRTLSLAVPLFSVAAAFSVALAEVELPERSSEQLAALVGLTIFGAGNGLLLGAAIGDFGRSILAMLVGAAAALLLAPLAEGFGVLLALLGVCALISGTLALDWSPSGILEAVWTGMTALAFGLSAAFLASVVLSVLLWLLVSAGPDLRARLILQAVCYACAMMLGNAVFIGRIFRASFRVESSAGTDTTSRTQAD